MGADINEADACSVEEFCRRLRADLAAAKKLLQRPGFGQGSTTIGAELELSLVDEAGRPALVNREVLAAMNDPRMTVELDRFNIEFNADPMPLAGDPFAALASDLSATIAEIDEAAATVKARSITIGTLPSLDLDLLSRREAMTDLPRYRALAVALRSFRDRPFELNIDGADPLVARCDGVTLEGANTSFQLHLHAPPDRYADTYNAAQLATPVALAVSGNAPLFCGHRLWEETRIVVFKQAVDIRNGTDGSWRRPPRVCFGHGWVRDGIYELLAEGVHLHEPLLPHLAKDSGDPMATVLGGGVPSLHELRLHLGTIWRWNRPIFDTNGDGHLRVELRSLPSGPTVVDMVASAAFYLGLTLGLRDRIGELATAVPFEYVRKGFYRAAQYGLDAELAWPAAQAPSPDRLRAADLARRLLPVAAEGLRENGVDEAAIERMETIISGRVESGQTGAAWQRRALTSIAGNHQPPSPEALAALTLTYLANANTNTPVHMWPIP